MRRLLLTRRWLGFTVLAVLVATGCVRLGLWQWERAGAKVAANDVLAERTAQPPVPLTDLLGPARPDPAVQWRAVTARGTYDPAATVLLRNRPLERRAGFHVLVPLRLADGSAVLVNRGWVPRDGTAAATVPVPAPPAGEVEVTGRVRTSEPVSADDLGWSPGPPASVSRVDPAGLAELTGRPLVGGWVELAGERPPPADAPVLLPAPSGQNPGVNYAYAVQWFVFAVIALVGWWLLLRREAAGPPARPRVLEEVTWQG